MCRNLSFLFCELPSQSVDVFFSDVNTLFADLVNVKNIPTYLNFDNEQTYCLHHQSPKKIKVKYVILLDSMMRTTK